MFTLKTRCLWTIERQNEWMDERFALDFRQCDCHFQITHIHKMFLSVEKRLFLSIFITSLYHRVFSHYFFLSFSLISIFFSSRISELKYYTDSNLFEGKKNLTHNFAFVLLIRFVLISIDSNNNNNRKSHINEYTPPLPVPIAFSSRRTLLFIPVAIIVKATMIPTKLQYLC